VDTSTLKIVPVNLDTYVAGPLGPCPVPRRYPRIVYARTNGFAFVLAGKRQSLRRHFGGDARTDVLGAVSELAVARNGATFVPRQLAARSTTPLCAAAIVDRHSSFLNATDFPDNCQDVAISNDASRIYLACRAVYHFMVFDGRRSTRFQRSRAMPTRTSSKVAADGRVLPEHLAGMG